MDIKVNAFLGRKVLYEYQGEKPDAIFMGTAINGFEDMVVSTEIACRWPKCCAFYNQ